MWRYNPISDTRLALLHKSVDKFLRKQRGREWYNFSQAFPEATPEQKAVEEKRIDDWHQHSFNHIDKQLKHLGDADPTSNGQYARWILGLILKNNIELPEDTVKVRDLLENYHRVKNRLPNVAQRQIKVFDSYQHLRSVLVPLLPQLRSRAELQREGMRLLASEIISGAKYDLYQLLNVEATTKAAQNTGWCVCGETTAARYLKDGPLYLIMRDGKRHALAHMDAGYLGATGRQDDIDWATVDPAVLGRSSDIHWDPDTIQVMDINDVPIDPSHYTHRYDDVAHLFGLHLPQFICKEHSPEMELFKGHFEAPKIYNLECENCNSCGCYETHKLCQGDGCPKSHCEDCDWVCVDCQKPVCDDHSSECCGGKKCKDHILPCNDCGEDGCGDCLNYVDCCDESICNDCAKYCSSCETTGCENHMSMEECTSCPENACEDCRKAWTNFECCSVEYCDACTSKSDTCDECNTTLCENHSYQCEVCGKDLCSTDKISCDDCYDDFCYDHHDQGQECTICEYHSHGTIECVTCDKPFCSHHIGHWNVELQMRPLPDHAARCESCRKPVCPDHTIPCDCPRNRYDQTPHYYCQSCLPRNICPVCKTTFCVPERHLPCAYTRKKRQLRRRNRRRF